MTLYRLCLSDSFGDKAVDALNVLQIEPEAKPVAPDAQEEDDTQREKESEGHVQALVVEWPGVGTRIDDGVLVDIHEQHVVAAIVEFLNEGLKSVAEPGCALVLTRVEEDIYIVWYAA